MNAYLFDIDGTLIRSGGAGRAALEAALLETFGIPEGTKGVMLSGRTDFGIHHELFELHALDNTTQARQRFLESYLNHLPKLLEQSPGRVLPGIIEILNALASQPNSHVGLLTGNVHRGARLKLEHYRLYHHFRFGGYGDLHANRDDVAKAALEALNIHHQQEFSTDRVWVIGDTPNDIRCARSIGARAVAVATGEFTSDQLRQAEPDLLFEDFSEPESFLSSLC